MKTSSNILLGTLGVGLLLFTACSVLEQKESPLRASVEQEVSKEKERLNSFRERERELINGVKVHIKLLDSHRHRTRAYHTLSCKGLQRIYNSKHFKGE